MKTFLKNILSTIIGIISATILLILLFIGIISLLSTEKEITVKENSILKLHVANISVVERKTENPFESFNIIRKFLFLVKLICDF